MLRNGNLGIDIRHMFQWKHNFEILMDSGRGLFQTMARREKEDLDTLSEWVKSVRSVIQNRIYKKSMGL